MNNHLPMGSSNGLLSTEMLYAGPGISKAEKTAPIVLIDVPLNGEYSKNVNFARLAEERYGFIALYPRLGAQRKILARVAAAGAALEKNNKASSGCLSLKELIESQLTHCLQFPGLVKGEQAVQKQQTRAPNGVG